MARHRARSEGPGETGPRNQVDLPSAAHLALRLGFRQIGGFKEDWGRDIEDARRAGGPFASIEHLARRAGLPSRALQLLADADACRSLGQDRRQALWEVRRTPTDELPLFAAAPVQAAEPAVVIPPPQQDLAAADRALRDHLDRTLVIVEQALRVEAGTTADLSPGTPA